MESDERLYFVVYDIGGPKRWRSVFRTMHGYGDWVQLSVFQCRLTRVRHAELIADLEGAFQGQTSHTAETLRTCTALRVPKTGRGEGLET